MMKPRKNGFTLIEMLTVVVIIAIILGIGVPALTSLMKSGGLSGASREVANALGLARQYAITHRTTTRVVFPYNGTVITPFYAVTMFTSATNLAPWYESYAVLSINSGVTNYVSKWEHLPLGTVFMDSGSAIDAGVGNPLSVDALGPPATFPFPYTNSPPVKLAYIEFQPTGAASNPGTLTITEGFVNSGTIVNPVTPTSKTSTSLVNSAIVSVDNIIGRIQVTRP